MQRHTLKDGGWVDIRDREEVTQRGRRGILAITAGLGDVVDRLQDLDETKPITAQGFTEDQIDAVLRMQEATVVAYVAGWSRPEPVPTLATVGDLPGALFDELAALTARKGAETALSLDTSPGDGSPDPKDRSGSSGTSSGPSKDDSEPTPGSTLTLLSGGGPSGTGS